MLPKFLADWRKLIIIAFLNFYACLCGMQPPVMRALLMSSIFLLAEAVVGVGFIAVPDYGNIINL